VAHITSESVDNAVKILADHIVENKTDVIRALNNSGGKNLPFSASVMEVNYAVGDNLFNRDFHEEIASQIFSDFRNQSGPPPPLPTDAVASGAGGAEGGANPLGYVIKIIEVGANLFVANKQAQNQRAALDARANLEAQRIEAEAQVAQQKAKQEFAFNLLKAQQDDPQDRTTQNLILLLGTLGFLGLAYYATTRNTTPKVS